jgi:NADPH-dependent F420 reductase
MIFAEVTMTMLGFLGGTGPEGRGLALRFAAAGHKVLLGSRDLNRAQEVADRVRNSANNLDIQGVMNDQVAQEAEIVLVTVPFEGHEILLKSFRGHLQGKVVVDTVVPLTFKKMVAESVPVAEGSASQQAQVLLPESHVVAAFQNVSAHDLLNLDHIIDGDVIVCGDHSEAKRSVMALAETIRDVRALDGGGLQNARYVEDITVLFLNMNRIYKGRCMVKVVGI